MASRTSWFLTSKKLPSAAVGMASGSARCVRVLPGKLNYSPKALLLNRQPLQSKHALPGEHRVNRQTNASRPERAVDGSESTSRAPVLRMRQLDSLRAFAVLAVLVHHFLPVEKIFPEDFLTLGLLGVRFFFTLSGFLITGILLRGQSL